MRRRDVLRLSILAPFTLRTPRLAGSVAEPNAVVHYRTALAALPKWSDAETATLDAFATTRLDLSALRLLRKSRGALEAFARGSNARDCDWLAYWTGSDFGAVDWIWTRTLARLALLRARFAFESGRERRALADISAALTLADHLQRGRVFIAQLIGFAIEHTAIEVVAVHLPRISNRGVRALSARLDRQSPPLPLEEAILAEREFFLGYIRAKEPEVYDKARMARLLPFYNRLIEAIGSPEETTLEAIRQSPEFDAEDRDSFLDHFEGLRRARIFLGVKRALLRSAIAVVDGGEEALRTVPDPTDGRPFGLRSWGSGFELSTRFALPEKPPATLLVGSRKNRRRLPSRLRSDRNVDSDPIQAEGVMKRVCLVLFWSAALTRTADPAPKPIRAWATGPLEARVIFDGPVPESLAKALVGMRIVFGDDVKAGDRYVERKVGDPGPSDRGSLRIAAARVEGPTLILATDPHSRDTTYALHLPAPVDVDLTYRLRGVEAVAGGSASVPAVWNSLDSSRIGERLGWIDPKNPLILKTLVALPKGKASLSFTACVPFSVDIGGETTKSSPDQPGHKAEVTTEVEADVVDLVWTLAVDGAEPLTFAATCRNSDEKVGRPLTTEQLILPWAPAHPSAAADTPVPAIFLSGGDPAKGARSGPT